jgi:type I restriction enzyme M protein
MGKTKKSKERIFLTPQSLNAAIKNMCDVLRRSNCAGAMQYIPELTWLLFLRILDEQETIEADNLSSGHENFTWSITSPYRWRDWASPYEPTLFDDPAIHKPQGWKRRELEAKGDGALLGFINAELFPALKALKIQAGATPRQKIIGEIMADIGQTRIDAEYNLQEVLDKADQISVANIDPKHIFPLSQVYGPEVQ